MLRPSQNSGEAIKGRNLTAGDEFASPDDLILLAITCLYKAKNALNDGGYTLTNQEAISLILITCYMSAEGEVNVTKKHAFNKIIRPFLDVSFQTFNRIFNSLVQKKFFNPLGVRGNGDANLAEEFIPTMKSKQINLVLANAIRDCYLLSE